MFNVQILRHILGQKTVLLSVFVLHYTYFISVAVFNVQSM